MGLGDERRSKTKTTAMKKTTMSWQRVKMTAMTMNTTTADKEKEREGDES